MRFGIPGNEDVRKALVSMVDGNRIPHAIMLYENDGCGALPLALDFLQYLGCPNRSGGEPCGECPACNKYSKLIHPDVHFVFPVSSGTKVSGDKLTSEPFLQYWRELVLSNPCFLEDELATALGIEGKSSLITVHEARSLLGKLSLSTVERGYRSIVIYLPEKMNADAANRLLKSVEEPPENTVFLLVTHAPEKVLPTISSRCLCIRMAPLSKAQISSWLVDNYGVDGDKAAALASMAGGSLGKALSLLSESEDEALYNELFKTLIDSMLARDPDAALKAGDAISSLPSREKLKAFCSFASDSFRNIFLIQQGLPQLSTMPPGGDGMLQGYAKALRKNFPRFATGRLDECRSLIERNVNAKIIFCDFVCRLYISIWKTI